MYKQKYTPEEKLEKIKLFMKYDSSKTLNENKNILEQSDISGDIRDIKDEVGSFNTDESEIIKIIQKYKTKADFQKLADSYKEKYKTDFGTSLYSAINSNDPTESKQLTDHLSSLGINVKAQQAPGERAGTWQWVLDFGGSSPEADPNKAAADPNKAAADPNKKQQTTTNVPAELKDVKVFQDWLDKNKPGWATGYPGNILNKAGGYGKFGPRTIKAWSQHKDEFLKSAGTPEKTAEPENKFDDVYGDEPNSIISSN
jgi:hypothetical protein